MVEMENETSEKFTWTIKNFTKLDQSDKIYSENFFLGGHTWRILMYPNNCECLSIFLDAGDIANLPYGWTKFAKFRLAVINQLNDELTVTEETWHHFNAAEFNWGYKTFMPLDELCDTSKGFIINNTCVIEVEISTNMSSQYENKVIDAEICAKLVEAEISDSKSGPENKVDELVDFRGLGKIEKSFVPLLKEVCLCYPSLLESQQKRSRRFTEWAFTALGRVLHFLKTKKVKDMNDDDASNHLQILWEELETFQFDLAWLEPHVQSALAMKSYIERASEVKKLKDNVATLEMETKRLKAKITAAKMDLKIARRELIKAEQGFEERNLDAPLGYGGICVT